MIRDLLNRLDEMASGGATGVGAVASTTAPIGSVHRRATPKKKKKTNEGEPDNNKSSFKFKNEAGNSITVEAYMSNPGEVTLNIIGPDSQSENIITVKEANFVKKALTNILTEDRG